MVSDKPAKKRMIRARMPVIEESRTAWKTSGFRRNTPTMRSLIKFRNVINVSMGKDYLFFNNRRQPEGFSEPCSDRLKQPETG
jgi:hypothetical protein